MSFVIISQIMFWQLVLQGKVWLSAKHMPGVANITDETSPKHVTKKTEIEYLKI